MGKIQSTFGELLFALVMSSIASVFAAVAGVIGVYFVCAVIFGWEQAGWSPLLFGPPTAHVFGLTGFVLVFRWIKNYGNPKTSDSGNEPS
jgi:hypothetical protein